MALKLKPDPTFKAQVAIPLHGGGETKVEFDFQHRTRDELEAWLKAGADRDDVDAVLEAARGWELVEPFDRENVSELVQNYIGAARAVVDTYVRELSQARLGN